MNNTIELSQEKQESLNSIPVESFKEFNVVQIQKFQKILSVLNRYHNAMMFKSQSKSQTQISREKIEKENPENLIVKVRKFGDHEYVVDAEIKNVVRDTWIHVDGIAQERKLVKDKPDHPIFKIECLEDIYNM